MRNFIYLCLAHMSEEGWEQKYVKEAFDTNWVVPMGPNVNAFEQNLADFVNRKTDGNLDRKVVCLSAGTAAVHLALIGCGVKAGDEVLVQSFTFCASSHPVTYLGAMELDLCLLVQKRIHGIWIRSYLKWQSRIVKRKQVDILRLLFRLPFMVCLIV